MCNGSDPLRFHQFLHFSCDSVTQYLDKDFNLCGTGPKAWKSIWEQLWRILGTLFFWSRPMILLKSATVRKGSGCYLGRFIVPKLCFSVLFAKFNLWGGGPPVEISILKSWKLDCWGLNNTKCCDSAHFFCLEMLRNPLKNRKRKSKAPGSTHWSRKTCFHIWFTPIEWI